MTARCVVSPRARGDIEDIWNYTVTHWGIDQARDYIAGLQRSMLRIAAQPSLARPCPEVRVGYYRYHSGSHVLFFRLIENGVDVVRILHRRMDVNEHF